MRAGQTVIWHPRLLGGPPRKVELERVGTILCRVRTPIEGFATATAIAIARTEELLPVVRA